MSAAMSTEHLSQMATQWSMVLAAHRPQSPNAALARRELLDRYRGVATRYLLGAVRDKELADDLSQEFSLRMLRGDFRRANPEKGRFRNYLKVVLINLVREHQRAAAQSPRTMPENFPEPAAAESAQCSSESEYLRAWREELLDRTWQALQEVRPKYYAVLRTRVDFPDMSSAEIAGRLSSRFGQPFTAVAVRKTMQRAQEKFAELLIDEVAFSAETTDLERISEDLRELDLLKYCRAALERRRECRDRCQTNRA